jgi:hypothetical protein
MKLLQSRLFKRPLRKVVVISICVEFVLFAAVFLVLSYVGLPDLLFYRRIERQFCIRCGSQAFQEGRIPPAQLMKNRTVAKIVLSPTNDGIDAAHCNHIFLMVAFNERYLDVRRHYWENWTYGNMKGEPLYSSPALIKAFVSLSSTNSHDATELFMFLASMLPRQLGRDQIVAAVDEGNSESILQAILQWYKIKGSMLPSERERAMAGKSTTNSVSRSTTSSR